MSLSPGTRLGPYEITALIGLGGMGEVYRARDTRLGRDVALKILPEAFEADPGRLARFQREARLLAGLNHPHIATLHGVEDAAGRLALVMELVEGPTLADRIAQGPIPLDEAVAIARQIASALEAAHERDIVHRDLKPANIKVREDGTVKVLDFGLAKATDPAGDGADAADSPTITSPAMTMRGVILGTAAYMSPEQARGKRVDKRADIWAFGCVLYEMVTGKRPFAGDDVTETIAAVVKVNPDLSVAPGELRALLEHCLEKDPRKRLRDIGDAWRLVSDVRPAPMASAPAISGRPRARWIAGASVAGVLIGAAGMWTVRSPGAPAPATVTRFTETLPEAVALSPSVAVSPDGRALVYRMREGGRGWLQRRFAHELQAAPIGDVMANDPAFSPDGEWVVYRVGQLLKRVSVNGGASQTLATLPSDALIGVAWDQDGAMLIGSARAGLQRVAADGGPLTTVTSPEGGLHMWPEVLPGGRGVLYTFGETPTGGDIRVLDTASGKSRPLGEGANARYVRTGHLVFFRDGSLWAVPFDVGRLEMRGTPRAVLAGVRTAASFSISDTGTLVYLPEAPAQTRSLVWVNRQGTEEALPIDAGAWSNPRLSPDDRFIAMPLRVEGVDVWIWDLASRSLRQLTSDPMPNYLVAWAPDGRRVAFPLVFEGRAQLHWQASDGSGTAQLIAPKADPRGEFPYGFARDGSLLYSVATTDIAVLEPSTGTRRPLVEGPAIERNAAVSPNGRWFAFESNRTGRNEIYVRPFPNAREGEWTVTRDGGMTPIWSRDGGELYYWKLNGPVVSVNAVPITAGTSFAFGKSRELFKGAYAQTSWDTSYDVARDGRFLMMKGIGTLPRDEVVVVQNWTEELRRLVPVNR
jgi:serine/threonine-protein kinase